MEPKVVQVMLRVSLTIQTSPPLGTVRVNVPWILKLALEVSKTVESETSVILTLQVALGLSGIVQE